MSYVVQAPFLLPLGEDAALIVRTPAIAEPYHAMIIANQERLAQWEPWATAPQDLDGTRAFLAADVKNWGDGTELPTAIVARAGDTWVLAGAVGLRIDAYRQTGRLGYWCDAAHVGRGLVTRAARTVLDYAFATLGLARVEISTTADNVRSRAVAERLGAVQEGVLREAVGFPDHRRDAVLYGILAREWTYA